LPKPRPGTGWEGAKPSTALAEEIGRGPGRLKLAKTWQGSALNRLSVAVASESSLLFASILAAQYVPLVENLVSFLYPG